MANDANAQRARLARGEQLEAGWCFNPDRNPDVYKCSDEEQHVAAGDISVSWDGTKVTDLSKGEVTLRDQPKAFRVQAGTMTAPNAPATGADTQTTDNAPARARG